MKICHVITALDQGGAEILLSNVANIMSKEHEIHVICLKHQTKIINRFSTNVKVQVIGLNFSTVFRLHSLLKILKPEIVHTHLGHADFLGLISTLGLKTKRFCTMHNIWFKKNAFDYVFFALYIIYFNILFRDAKVISISDSVYQHVRKWYRLDDNRNFLLKNAIGGKPSLFSKHDARQYCGFENNQFIITFVGRFSKQKNLPFLLKSFKEISLLGNDIKLCLVGEGDLLVTLKQMVFDLGLVSKVVFLGVKENVNDFIKMADLLVLPSIFEGFGLVILEAFREGTPVIASNIEGPKELIEHNKDGMLFTSGSEREFVSAVTELYNDRNKLLVFSENAKNKFRTFGTLESYCQKLTDFYLSGK
ncbi:MAG: glycosyltransferase family 4 protein [Cytophagales bacterium]